VHYDPMLAKVIAHAESRSLAIARLAAALRSFPILGIHTNIPFLIRVLESGAFGDAAIDTAYLDNAASSLASESDDHVPAFVASALSALSSTRSDLTRSSETVDWDPWTRLRGIHA
jgi:acetyl/propionyl-CoA carboxylase alpha subunit